MKTKQDEETAEARMHHEAFASFVKEADEYYRAKETKFAFKKIAKKNGVIL